MLRTEKTTKIKPCPFCGQEGAGAHYDHGYWSVTCGYRHDGAPSAHCFQDWGEFETEEEAAEAWNRRAEAPNPPLTLEELRQMDGEPVWVIGVSCINNFQGHWDIFDWSDGHMLFCKSLEEPDLENYDPDGRLGIAGWRAYRRKPEEEK